MLNKMHNIQVVSHYLFWSLYRDAASYISNKINPLLFIILLPISSQNLQIKVQSYFNVSFFFLNKQNTWRQIEAVSINHVPFSFQGPQHIHKKTEMKLI